LSEPDKEVISQFEAEKFYLPNICTVQSLFFMVLAGTLLSIVFTLLSSDISNFPWDRFAVTAFVVLWIILPCCAVLCQLRPFLLRLSLLHGLIVSYIIILLVTGTVSLLGQWMNIKYLGAMASVDVVLTAQHVLIAGILAGVALRYLYLQQQLNMQQQAELASRIQALQSRIRPHFLFNSMNIIASLIATDPDMAEEVVEDLSDLFRATLSEANQLVAIDKEVELLEKYVHIEHLRLGDRLQVDWQIDHFDESVLIPHLSLQPLVENAIYHGIQPLPQGGKIVVKIVKQDKKVAIDISNPCPMGNNEVSRPPNNKQGNKLALENLRHRLQAYYKGEASLNITQEEGHFSVSFQYPIMPVEQART